MENTVCEGCCPVTVRHGRRGWWSWVVLLWDIRRQRKDLARLSVGQLQDVGVSRNAAQKEARKPLWDVPTHWLK